MGRDHPENSRPVLGERGTKAVKARREAVAPAVEFRCEQIESELGVLAAKAAFDAIGALLKQDGWTTMTASQYVEKTAKK